MKKILTRKDYLITLNEKFYSKYTGYSLLKEEAPMANDIPWGDSLVGRLINSFARKAKISFNKRRISGLVTGLKGLFDEMLVTGSIQMPDEQISRIKISNLLGILIEQVEAEEDVNVLIDTTGSIIDLVDESNFDNKDEMLKSLNDFLEYLKGLKSGKDDSEKDDNAEKDEETEKSDPNKIFFTNSKLLLQSVIDLHSMIKQNVVRVGGGQESYDNKVASAKSKLKVGSEYWYTNVDGEKIRCMLLSLTNKIERAADKKWLTEDDAVGSPAFSKFRKLEPDQACVVYKSDVQDYNKVYSSQVVELLKLYPIGGKEPGKVEKPGENLSTNFNKEKYLDLEKKYLSSKNYEILKNLIKIGGQAIKIYTAKKDNQNSKFYTDKTNNYISSLVKIQAKSYGISTEETKDFKQPDGTIKKKPTGKHKDIKTLKDEIRDTSKEVWSVDLPLGKSSGKVSQPPTGVGTMQTASYNIEIDLGSILEEVEANLQKEESHAKIAWNKVVNSFNKSGIENFIKEIESLLKISIKDGKDEYKKAKNTIISICKQVVLNKSTVGKPISFDDLIKEAMAINDVSKSISLVGRILISFKEDIGLAGSYGSAGKPLRDFVNSFNELEKNISKISSEKKESISKYSEFLLIQERNEFSEDIKNKFDEIFTDDIQEYFIIGEDEIDEIKDSAKETPGGELLFTTADPIIEIVRIFHRANRIHTPGVIPSGRSGGKVSNSVFREYEDLGTGGGTPDSPGSGPYRNIELYDSWFNAVQDILSDTKYRPIFSEKAVFQFKNEETGGIGDRVEAGGKILLKFINSLLSDSKMYKSGAINDFIQEYFKLKDGIPSSKQSFNETKEDVDRNEKVSEDVKVTNTKYVKPAQVRDLNTDDLYKTFTGPDSSDNENLSFKMSVKDDEGKNSVYYCVFKGFENQYPVFVFSPVNFPYDLSKVTGISTATIARDAFVASFSKSTSVNRIKVGEKINIRYVSIKSPQESQVNADGQRIRVELTVTELLILCNDKSEKYLGFDTNYSPSLKTDFNNNLKAAKNLVKQK
jgi:hypothetical protein